MTIVTDRINTAYIQVTQEGDFEGKIYPCSSIQMLLGLNTVPSITATCPDGNPIGEIPGQIPYESPLFLAQWIQSNSDSGSNNTYIACRIYESRDVTNGTESKQEDILIFEGYIVFAGILYTGTGKTGIQVSFNCMGKAVKLYTRPLTAWINVAAGSLMNLLENNRNISANSAINSAARLVSTTSLSLVLGAALSDSTIAEMIINCIGVLKTDLTLSNFKQLDIINKIKTYKDKDAEEAFFGSTKLTNDLNATCKLDYVSQLYTALMHGVESGDIFSALVGILTSDEYALQLIPRWKKDSFKMEICQSKAWLKSTNTSNVVKIQADMIESVSTSTSISNSVNDPDIVICNFNDLRGFTQSDNTGVTGIFGVYAKNAEINKDLRDSISDNQVLRNKLKKYGDMNFKIRIIWAPKWLNMGIADNTSKAIEYNNQDNRTSAAVIKQKPEASGVLNTKDLEEDKPSINKESGNSVAEAFAWANNVAELLFLYKYKKADVALVTLTPNCRFGLTDICLEDNIGSTIELDLSKALKSYMRLKIRGTLENISYAYSAADASIAKYTISLSRVRLADAQVPMIEKYPIYGEAVNG